METESQKLIEDQIKKLPPEVRDALASDELHTKIVEIGQKHHLHIDQIGILEDEVVLTMIGLTDPSQLAEELVKQTSLEAKSAEEIAGDVSQAVFLPIRAAMQKFMEKQASEEKSVVMPSTQSNPPATPKPTPAPAPITPAASTPAATPKPQEMHPAELMLKEPTVSMAPKIAPTTPAPTATTPATPSSLATQAPTPANPKAEAPKLAPYKADPYREPPE